MGMCSLTRQDRVQNRDMIFLRVAGCSVVNLVLVGQEETAIIVYLF